MKRSLFITAVIFLLAAGCNRVSQTTKNVAPIPATSINAINIPQADWKTYTNSEYGFELKFPPHWAAMKVEPDGLSFDLPYASTSPYAGEYEFICGIKFYGQKAWDELQNSKGPKPSDVLGQKNGGVFSYECTSDDGGYASFEEYNQGLLNYQLHHETPKNTVGPNEEFNKLVIPTFKLIDPAPAVNTTGWKTYTSSKSGFQFKYPSNFKIVLGQNYGLGQSYDTVLLQSVNKDKYSDLFILTFTPLIRDKNQSLDQFVHNDNDYGQNLGAYYDSEAITSVNNMTEYTFNQYMGASNSFHSVFIKDETHAIDAAYPINNWIDTGMWKDAHPEGATANPHVKIFNEIISTFKFAK
jgi:hypothetical protein